MATAPQEAEGKLRDSQAPGVAPGNAPESFEEQDPSNSVGPAVRFKSTVQEIAPEESLSSMSTTTATKNSALGQPGEVTPEQIRALSKSLQGNHLQERRLKIFSFEPFSLPASRTPSHEDSSRDPSRQQTRSPSSHQSPVMDPRGTELHSPPLTPAETDGVEEAKQTDHSQDAEKQRPTRIDIITPQESTQEASPKSSSRGLPRRPSSSEDVPKRPSSELMDVSHGSHHRRGLFSIGPAAGSLPVSRESSPNRAANFYTRPFTPAGDDRDPYARGKRASRGPNDEVEPRFHFSRRKARDSPSSSAISLPRAAEKRQSGFLSAMSKGSDLYREDTHGTAHSRTSSMSDLKRFFKMGVHHKMKRAASPASSFRSGTRTPPSSRSSAQIPFGDDHGLTSKYGKLGKVLGSGAGGSVRLMKRSEDNTVFAVKEFRPRHSYETEKEYVKKLTAEYCIGSSLHHGNIIETLDIVHEKGKWYEVMEYAPYDLFAIVMTGKMSREEVSCCFLQILSGVTYLHSMGLAHRDLKLDNVVVNEHGIMKIIDFGSAHVFKYPFENGVQLASGIVGSDPYLAPEVYEERKYDPQAVDIWSLAIIYCCMTLRRFPWKVPRLTDNSYKLFAADPTPGHDPRKLILPPNKSTSALHDLPQRDMFPGDDDKLRAAKREQEKGHKPSGTGEAATGEKREEPKKEVVRGPWRILRLLPRESRHVIGRMLEIDPRKRTKMPDVLEDSWVSNTVICRQVGPGEVVNATDHTHILEPPSANTTSK